ncbi:hypothetical protein [Nocardioides convexus]|uniref:hypothetical protein n=1 Tax=Nocardioides convexus TaxID=2712224 RepID=UPI00241865EB|nr:hypothetical protein [Nocardioides convexus]
MLLIVTDGEPTSHLESSGDVFFSYPPHPATIALAVRETRQRPPDRCAHHLLPPRRGPGAGAVHRRDGAPGRRLRGGARGRGPGRRGRRLLPRLAPRRPLRWPGLLRRLLRLPGILGGLSGPE